MNDNFKKKNISYIIQPIDSVWIHSHTVILVDIISNLLQVNAFSAVFVTFNFTEKSNIYSQGYKWTSNEVEWKD